MSALVESYRQPLTAALKQTLTAYVHTLAVGRKQLDDAYIPVFLPQSATATRRLLVLALLRGIADTSRKKINLADSALEPEPEKETLRLNRAHEPIHGYVGVRFEEAEKILQVKFPVTRAEWESLDQKLALRAFAVNRLAQIDAIARVQNYIAKAMSSQDYGVGGLKGFIATTTADELLQKAGWGAQSPWYWETVYRTNVQSAYNHGRALQWESDPPQSLRYAAIGDARTSKICMQRDGMVRPYSDQWWKTNWPPLHFNCRSTLVAIYDQAKTTLTLPANEKNGFGHYPLTDDYWNPTSGMLKRMHKAGVDGDLVPLSDKKSPPEGLYSLSYTAPSGGEVWVSLGHGKGLNAAQKEQEMRAAKALAGLEKKVYMVAESTIDGVKNPDAWADGQYWEFKAIMLKPHTSVTRKRAIERNLKSAYKQTQDCVLLVLSDEFDDSDIEKGVAVFEKTGTPKAFQTILFLRDNGKIIRK